MTKPASQLYRVNHQDLASQLSKAIDQGCSQCNTAPVVFFRADDIAIPSHNFTFLIQSFTKNQLPLCLATVPTWLTSNRLSELQTLTGASTNQWYWHQHGYVHRNFESTGKKQEFGPARKTNEVEQSLKSGKLRLNSLLGKLNQPVFTPPWNRCSEATLQALQSLDFKAISRSKGATPPTQPGFTDFQVNVDLHTRKEESPELSLNNLLAELEYSLASGMCGIMLHHQRMNRRAVDFLNILLECLKKQKKISFVHFGDLIGS